MRTLDALGRRLTFWGALFLVVWAGYELSIRWDTIRQSGYTVMLMAQDNNISLADVLIKYKFIEVLRVPLILAGCVLLGLFALLLRNRRRAAYVLIPLCALFAWLNADARVFFFGSLWQFLKTVPLAMIGVGQAVNAGVALRIGHRKGAGLPPAPNGRRFLRGRDDIQ